MKEQNKNAMLGALIHLVAWISVDIIANYPLTPPQANTYGEFLPWWSALYFGYVFTVTPRALVPLAGYYLAFFSLESLFSWNIIYHDAPSLPSIDFWLAYVMTFVIFASPVIVNASLRWLLGLRKKG